MGLTIFATRMKQARENKGMKQNELAKAVGLTPTTISSYEKSDIDGNGKKPTLENAQSIAEQLNVSLDWLSGISEKENTSIATFNVSDYLKSILIVLLETSSCVQDDTISFNNKVINHFIRKANDLIKVYQNGTLEEDMFNVCIEKLLSDYKDYCIFGNCFLDSYEEMDALNTISNIPSEIDVKGLCSISVSQEYDSENVRTVNIFVNEKLIDSYFKPKD